MTITPGKYFIRNRGTKGLYVKPQGVIEPDEGQASIPPIPWPVISIPPEVLPQRVSLQSPALFVF